MPSRDGSLDVYSEPFEIHFAIPEVDPDYDGPSPLGFEASVETTCDADTPEDESDDHVSVGVSGSGMSAPNALLSLFRPAHACGGRRVMNGERVTLLFRVSYTDTDGTTYSREFALVLTGVGGTNAGEFDPDLIQYSPLGSCDGGRLDPETDLCWEDPPSYDITGEQLVGGDMNWADARAYCEGLSSGGRDDWRLPTIDELRTLIRPPYTYSLCAQNLPGGVCGVTDPNCLNSDPCAENCSGCFNGLGPAEGGCFCNRSGGAVLSETTAANPSRKTGFRPRAGSSGTGSTILAGPAGALGFSGALAAALSKA